MITSEQPLSRHSQRLASKKKTNNNLQVIEVGSFNLKDNMKASYGVSFKENDYLDKGPNYADHMRKKEAMTFLSMANYHDIKSNPKSSIS